MHVKINTSLAKLVTQRLKQSLPGKPPSRKASSSPPPLVFLLVSPAQSVFCDYYQTKTIYLYHFFNPLMKHFYRDGVLRCLKRDYYHLKVLPQKMTIYSQLDPQSCSKFSLTLKIFYYRKF